jgi:hypothetical protein
VRPRRGGPQAPKVDPTRRQQGQYLRRLGRVIIATYGAGAECELRWQEKVPFLPYLLVRGVPVWAVSTSAGWRFLWNRYRSHPVTDPSGQTVSGEGSAAESNPPDRKGSQAEA